MNTDETMLLAIGRLEGKLDAYLHRAEAIEDRTDAVEERVGKLERYRAWLVGVAAAVGVFASIAFHFWG